MAELGSVGAWGHLDSLPVTRLLAYARRVEELGYGTLWMPETVGREPFTALGLLAGETRQMRLGTSIVSIWGHDPQTTRMAAMTLAEATGGRFVLGLGVSHPHLAGKLRGHAYEKPLTRMREFLAAYRSAVYKGPMATPDRGEPPVLLAALRERMLGLAAGEADGAFPYLFTPERVAWARGVLDQAAADVGRPRPLLAISMPAVLEDQPRAARDAGRAYLAPYLRTPNYQASWQLQGFGPDDWEKPGSDRLVDAMVAWGSAARLRESIAELHAAGANHVAVIPLAPDGTTEHLPVLEALRPRFTCPACGYPGLVEIPWRGESASYEICPSCGIQFGYSDDAAGDARRRQEIHLSWRAKWVAGGMPWASKGQSPPTAWDAATQLLRLTSVSNKD
jgi:probable F420-dependent oxidoreductase